MAYANEIESENKRLIVEMKNKPKSDEKGVSMAEELIINTAGTPINARKLAIGPTLT